MDIKFFQHAKYIEVVVTGSYNVEYAVDNCPQLFEICRTSGLRKVLIDYRKLPQLGGAERSLFAIGLENHYEQYLRTGGHQLLFALVKSRVTAYEPGAEILDVSSILFKMFDDIDDALNWLLVENTEQIGQSNLQ